VACSTTTEESADSQGAAITTRTPATPATDAPKPPSAFDDLEKGPWLPSGACESGEVGRTYPASWRLDSFKAVSAGEAQWSGPLRCAMSEGEGPKRVVATCDWSAKSIDWQTTYSIDGQYLAGDFCPAVGAYLSGPREFARSYTTPGRTGTRYANAKYASLDDCGKQNVGQTCDSVFGTATSVALEDAVGLRVPTDTDVVKTTIEEPATCCRQEEARATQAR